MVTPEARSAHWGTFLPVVSSLPTNPPLRPCLPPPQGIEVLTKAVEAVKASIEGSKGRMVVKEEARAVSEKEERALEEELQAAEAANREVSGDTDEVGGGW